MKEEIVGGLKNAVEKGESLDKAVQSFINAGYNPVEVREAANLISSSTDSIIKPLSSTPSTPELPKKTNTSFTPEVEKSLSKTSQSSPSVQPLPAAQPLPVTQSSPAIPPTGEKKSHKMVISLVIILVILIALLIGTILFADDILARIAG